MQFIYNKPRNQRRHSLAVDVLHCHRLCQIIVVEQYVIKLGTMVNDSTWSFAEYLSSLYRQIEQKLTN